MLNNVASFLIHFTIREIVYLFEIEDNLKQLRFMQRDPLSHFSVLDNQETIY